MHSNIMNAARYVGPLALLLLGNACAPVDEAAQSAERETTAAPLLGGSVADASVLSGAVLFDTKDGYRCTGSFVTTTHILTAGGCVGGFSPRSPRPTRVRYTNATDSRAIFVQKWAEMTAYVHPYLDLAVIVFTEPQDVQPLPVSRWAPSAGDSVGVLGYGDQDHAGRRPLQRNYGQGAVDTVTFPAIRVRADSGFALCGTGDIGAPLLARHGAIVGVLHQSPEYFAPWTEFVDVSAAREWLMEIGAVASDVYTGGGP